MGNIKGWSILKAQKRRAIGVVVIKAVCRAHKNVIHQIFNNKKRNIRTIKKLDIILVMYNIKFEDMYNIQI